MFLSVGLGYNSLVDGLVWWLYDCWNGFAERVSRRFKVVQHLDSLD